MEQNLIMPDYLEYIKDITGINNYKVNGNYCTSRSKIYMYYIMVSTESEGCWLQLGGISVIFI